MAVTITAGSQIRPGTYQSLKSYSQSTATAVQTLDDSYDVLNVGMGTATGFGVNRYLLATDDTQQGREVLIQATATGEAKLIFTGTATGALHMSAATDSVRLRQNDGTWYVLDNYGATIATATGTA